MKLFVYALKSVNEDLPLQLKYLLPNLRSAPSAQNTLDTDCVGTWVLKLCVFLCECSQLLSKM